MRRGDCSARRLGRFRLGLGPQSGHWVVSSRRALGGRADALQATKTLSSPASRRPAVHSTVLLDAGSGVRRTFVAGSSRRTGHSWNPVRRARLETLLIGAIAHVSDVYVRLSRLKRRATPPRPMFTFSPHLFRSTFYRTKIMLGVYRSSVESSAPSIGRRYRRHVSSVELTRLNDREKYSAECGLSGGHWITWRRRVQSDYGGSRAWSGVRVRYTVPRTVRRVHRGPGSESHIVPCM